MEAPAAPANSLVPPKPRPAVGAPLIFITLHHSYGVRSVADTGSQASDARSKKGIGTICVCAPPFALRAATLATDVSRRIQNVDGKLSQHGVDLSGG